MKNARRIFGLALAIAFVLSATASCAGGAQSASGANQAARGGNGVNSLNDVEGKEWTLSEIRSAGTTVRIDRSKLPADGGSGAFTINFQDGMASGMGWPNRYRGPYTKGSGDALSIGNAASTMMAAFVELDELKENEYYGYLSRVTRWAVRDGRLELYSTNAGGGEAVLVYVLN